LQISNSPYQPRLLCNCKYQRMNRCVMQINTKIGLRLSNDVDDLTEFYGTCDSLIYSAIHLDSSCPKDRNKTFERNR